MQLSDSQLAQVRERLITIFERLYAHFGHESHWWPIRTDDLEIEVFLGTILVQQTRWETVEAAIVRVQQAGLLSWQALAQVPVDELAALIKPCAFYTQKAQGIVAIAQYLLEHYGGNLRLLLQKPRNELRAELLALPRVGRETADTIMLYAGGTAVFIVDAYARRMFSRVGLGVDLDFNKLPYDTIQAIVEQALAQPLAALPSEPQAERSTFRPDADSSYTWMWNLHALINELCIHHCLATRMHCDRPGTRRRSFVDKRKCSTHCIDCSACPLMEICMTYQDSIKLLE